MITESKILAITLSEENARYTLILNNFELQEL